MSFRDESGCTRDGEGDYMYIHGHDVTLSGRDIRRVTPVTRRKAGVSATPDWSDLINWAKECDGESKHYLHDEKTFHHIRFGRNVWWFQ